ncbi:MAG: DMT family transporter [Pseudomonadales bacterium]|nr:DMT family transporter [Pseudomonadales bacterium]
MLAKALMGNKKRLQRDAGLWLVGVAALLFACKGTVIKLMYAQGASVADVMLLRMLFSVPIYVWVAVTRIRYEAKALLKKLLILVVGIGVLGYYVASYLDLLGLQTISAGLERIILYTYPVFVLLLSVPLLHKKISWSVGVCAAIIYVGLLMVFFADIRMQPHVSLTETGKGALWVLLSALSFSLYVIGSDYCMRVLSSALFTAVAMLSASGMIVLHYAFTQSSFVAILYLPPTIYGLAAITAIFFTVLPSFMMSAGIKQIGPDKAGAVGMIGPVATVLIAGLVLGEAVSVLQMAGLAVVMLGVQRLRHS